MKPGTIITDLEGYDLGDDGAVVVSIDGDKVELALLDTKEIVTVDLDDLDYNAEDAVEGEGATEWAYDPEAMDSPELHSIRNLPLWWGPRDPNNPNTITDVIYRPEPYWRRQINRYYSVDGGVKMSRKRFRRRADPLYQMNPTPQQLKTKKQLQLSDGLPSRMRLEKWEGRKDDALDTEVLIAHTLDFWQQYRKKQRTYMTERGKHSSLDLSDWGIIYMRRAGLTRKEIELLFKFMAATQLIPENEYNQFRDKLDSSSFATILLTDEIH